MSHRVRHGVPRRYEPHVFGEYVTPSTTSTWKVPLPGVSRAEANTPEKPNTRSHLEQVLYTKATVSRNCVVSSVEIAWLSIS